MFIQGDLQTVFDALYSVGAIDPVLGMDWTKITAEMERSPQLVNQVYSSVNACRGDYYMLVQTLRNMEPKYVHYIAMEVAREFSEYQDRKDLH